MKSLVGVSIGSLPVQLDPNVRTQQEFLAYLKFVIPQMTTQWTDFSPGDPGVALLEAMSMGLGILSYQTDRTLNEAYLPTAQQRTSIVDMAKLSNFPVSLAASASVKLTVVTSAAATLPTGWAVRSNTGVKFELLSQIILPAGGTHDGTIDDPVIVYQGETITDEVIGVSDGSINQTYTLDRSDITSIVGFDPVQIKVDVDVWTIAPGNSFIKSLPTDKVFTYSVAADNSVTITFSDGINGTVPPSLAEIKATFRIGNGVTSNNLGINTITQFDAVTNVTSITNADHPSGGDDLETSDDIRFRVPLFARTNDRAVTDEDHTILALSVSGISFAKAVTGPLSTTMRVYVATDGINPVPTGRWYAHLKTGSGKIGEVGRFLTSKRGSSTSIEVLPPVVVRPKLRARIRVLNNYLRSAVSFDVQAALIDIFNVSRAFGEEMPISNVYQTIENTKGVSFVNIDEFHRTPAFNRVVGSVVTFDAATKEVSKSYAACTADVYTVEWLSSAAYRLRGSISGLILNDNGDIATFISDGTNYTVVIPDSQFDGRFISQFDIAITSSGNSRGDRWTFGVDEFSGNIALSDFEILVPTIDNNTLSGDEFALTYTGGINV